MANSNASFNENFTRQKYRREGESSSKEEVCKFSNCDETGHRRVVRVSYNDRTTDGGACSSLFFDGDIHPAPSTPNSRC